MKDYLVTIDSLDNNNVAKTLRFSLRGYNDVTYGHYEQRILTPSLINISANDGGLFNIFQQSSLGDIELDNSDGSLNYLADYAIDGRDVTIGFLNDNDSITERIKCTASRISESDNKVIISLRAWHETLSDNLPLTKYLGNNTSLEGVEEIKDKVKPIVLGDCRNISPTLIDDVLLIYQVSNRSDCIITDVYDDGVRFNNFKVSVIATVNSSVISVKEGVGTLAVGKKINFSNDYNLYTITNSSITNGVGTITITPNLAKELPVDTDVSIVNDFANTTQLTAIDKMVNGDHIAQTLLNNKSKVINVTGGTATISAGDIVTFGSHLTVYEVASTTTGQITLTDYLKEDLSNGDIVNLFIAPYRSYNGYFRLLSRPAGAITVDAISLVDDDTIHLAGDVMQLLCDYINIDLDTDFKTVLNNAGIIGLFIDSEITALDAIDKVIKSVVGYYYLVSESGDIVMKGGLLAKPVTSGTVVNIEQWQIDSIARQAIGIGSNGLPIYKMLVNYDKIETVQTNNASSSEWFNQRTKLQYRKKEKETTLTKTRHKLSTVLEVESLLRYSSAVDLLIARLVDSGFITTRCDTIAFSSYENCGTIAIGDTIQITDNRLNYVNRRMVITGYELDDSMGKTTYFCYG